MDFIGILIDDPWSKTQLSSIFPKRMNRDYNKMSWCLKHHSDTEVVSVNHSKHCLKSSNAKAKRRVKYKRVCFKESKFSFKVNSKNLAKFRINLAVGNLYFWSSLSWKAVCLKNNNILDSFWQQEFYLQS